jgi:hypothetical protein
MPAVTLGKVHPGSTISTYEMGGDKDIGHSGYPHIRVNHNRGQYADRRTGASIDGLASFFSQLKRAINGTHIHVSGKHRWKYRRKRNTASTAAIALL